MRANAVAAIRANIKAGPIVGRDRGCGGAEFVIQAGAEDVVPDLGGDGAVRRHSAAIEHRVEGIRDGAEIEVQIFFLYRPVAAELGFDAPARRPTGLHLARVQRPGKVVDCEKFQKAGAARHPALGRDLAIGKSASGKKQGRARCIAESATHRPEPVQFRGD